MKLILIITILLSLALYSDLTKPQNPIFASEESYKNYLHYLEKNGLN
jgi:hypothetical protein